MTHWLPPFCEYRAGLFKAVCGTWIDRREFRSDPSCDKCQLWLTAEDVSTSKVIGRISPEVPYGEDVRR